MAVVGKAVVGKAVVGLDLGGTKIQGVLLDGDGEVGGKAKVQTPTGGVDAVVASLVDCVGQLTSRRHIAAVGLGTPGVVDPGTGVVLRAPNLAGFDGPVPLAALLEAALGVGAGSVRIDNDVNVATVAEHRQGAGRGCRDVLGIFVGTGAGGGLVLDGALRRGSGGLAGEIGHTIVRPGGRRCGCGLDGHLDSYAGRASLEREARRRAEEEGEATLLVELAGDGRMKSGVFAKAATASDPLTLELLDEAVDALGTALASAVALVDVERVVVGGGLAGKLGPAFVARVAEATAARMFTRRPVDVVPAHLGDLAGAIGAALLCT